MSSATERHNRIAREFVQMAGTQTKTSNELMVVMESTMLAAMHMLVRLHGIKPSLASTYMEVALQAATERYSQGADQ